VTTGTPIALLIDNVDQRSKDYSDIKDKYRPGHADYTYDVKYGLRDYRGGGRQSARETAMRVAAGAIARKIVPGFTVRGALVQMGPHRIDRARWDWAEVDRNPFFCPDPKTAAMLGDYLDGLRKRGSSIGAVIVIGHDEKFAMRKGRNGCLYALMRVTHGLIGSPVSARQRLRGPRRRPADLAALAQIMIGDNAGHHRLADRHRTDADARVVAANR